MASFMELNDAEGRVVFDGTILEIFGFGKSDSKRIALNQIKEFKTMKGSRGTINLVIVFQGGMRSTHFNENLQGSIDEFISVVNSAR